MNKNSAFSKRYDLHKDEFYLLYKEVYSNNPYYPVDEKFQQLVHLMGNYSQSRKPNLKRNDTSNADWYKKNDIIGTTLYIDLFSSNIQQFK